MRCENKSENMMFFKWGYIVSAGFQLIIALIVVGTFFAADTHAALVEPGWSGSLAGATVANHPELEGDILEDAIKPFNFKLRSGDNVSGTLQVRVAQEIEGGTLSFYYRIKLNDEMPEGECCLQFTVSNFAGFRTDVDYRIDGLGKYYPISAVRTEEGDEINFDFSGFLPADDGSYYIYVQTNASNYSKMGVGKIGLTDTDRFEIPIFQPIGN